MQRQRHGIARVIVHAPSMERRYSHVLARRVNRRVERSPCSPELLQSVVSGCDKVFARPQRDIPTTITTNNSVVSLGSIFEYKEKDSR